MNKNKELTKIKETKDMGTEKTDKTEAVSSKIFRAIRHVAAILLTVVVLIWGISVQLDISTIKTEPDSFKWERRLKNLKKMKK